MSEKGLGLRVSRGASPAIPPATPLAPSPKAPGGPEKGFVGPPVYVTLALLPTNGF